MRKIDPWPWYSFFFRAAQGISGRLVRCRFYENALIWIFTGLVNFTLVKLFVNIAPMW